MILERKPMDISLANWLLIVIAAFSSVIAAFGSVIAFLLWRISARALWLTGAMESHSAVDIMIKARQLQKEGVDVVWWDPSIHNRSQSRKWPKRGQHNEPFKLDTIYIGMSEADRQYQPLWIIRLLRGF